MNYSTENLLLFLVIGIVAGFIAGKIMKGAGFGLVGDLIVGVIGSFVGVWVFGLLNISSGGILGLLIAAIVGALILLYIIRIVKKEVTGTAGPCKISPPSADDDRSWSNGVLCSCSIRDLLYSLNRSRTQFPISHSYPEAL